MVGLKRNLLRSGEENHLKYAPVRASNSKKSSKIKSHHISGFWGKKKKREREKEEKRDDHIPKDIIRG